MNEIKIYIPISARASSCILGAYGSEKSAVARPHRRALEYELIIRNESRRAGFCPLIRPPRVTDTILRNVHAVRVGFHGSVCARTFDQYKSVARWRCPRGRCTLKVQVSNTCARHSPNPVCPFDVPGPAIRRSSLDRSRSGIIGTKSDRRWNPAAYPADRRHLGNRYHRDNASPLPSPPKSRRRGFRDRFVGANAHCCASIPPPPLLGGDSPRFDSSRVPFSAQRCLFYLIIIARPRCERRRGRGPPDHESTVVISDLIISRRRIIPVFLLARAERSTRERKRERGRRVQGYELGGL